MSSMAGSMVGSVVGHSIANSLFGGSEEGAAVESGQQAGAVEHAGEAQPAEGFGCDKEAWAFNKCLESSGGDLSRCQWAFDAMNACKVNAQQYSHPAQRVEGYSPYDEQPAQDPYDRPGPGM